MKTAWKLGLGAVLLLISAAPGWSQCDGSPSISLISDSAGVWTYGITVPAYNCTYLPGDTVVTLSGMTGVTGASTSGTLASDGFVAEGHTTTTATFDISPDPLLFGGTTGNLIVDSNSTPGTINWNISDPDPWGTVQGPVGAPAVPETSSLALLLTGMVTLGLLMGFARRKALRESGANQAAA